MRAKWRRHHCGGSGTWAATFRRLCDRKKFGMVGVRTASLSQFAVQTRHRDCNANCEYRRRGAKKMMAGKAVRQGRWTPRPEFSKLRLPEDERWARGFRRHPRGADQDRESPS